MDAREQRGLVIAALCKLNRKADDSWLVPSQTGAERIYRVNPARQTCSCPDHTEGGHKCKHLWAVEITMKREYHADGTVTDTRSVTFTEKKTYKQDWRAYNTAKDIEKDRVQELLFDLCQGVPQNPQTGAGRKRHTIRDSIFAAVFKVYCALPSRRVASDFRESRKRGYLSRPVPGQKVNQFLEKAELTPILKQLVHQSSLPLKSIETTFAIDSSGFGTSNFETWYDRKYGVTRRRCLWVKAHIASGTKTHVVTAIRVLDKDSHDSPQFVPLVRETASSFIIEEVSADKAYTSMEAFETVADCGGIAYLPFKSNASGGVGGLFQKMFHYFQFKQEEYMAHYHRRSNVESTFSMIKRRFGDSVRSRSDVAMVNEVLCKVVAHNLCCLIQEQHELGIEPLFWQDGQSETESNHLLRN
jgi:hypothetical protein